MLRNEWIDVEFTGKWGKDNIVRVSCYRVNISGIDRKGNVKYVCKLYRIVFYFLDFLYRFLVKIKYYLDC